jgi:leukotriene-A4 hydrolase
MRNIILLISFLVISKCSSIDPNTFSNYEEVKVNHLHLEWLLDLDNKYINGTAIYDFTVA